MAGYSKIINFIKDLYGNKNSHPLPFQSSLVTRRSISKSVLTPLSCRQWASLLIVLRMIWLATLDVSVQLFV